MAADPARGAAGGGRTARSGGGGSEPGTARVARVADDGPPGLEPTLGALRYALGELDAALSAAGAVRAALTELAAGAPGDDRVLVAFLRSRLGAPERRLLETLAGISEEHRALERATAEIAAIYGRPYHDPNVALARIAAATAFCRTIPVATFVVPTRDAGGRRGPSLPRAVAPVFGARPGDGRGDGRSGGSALGWLGALLRGGRPGPAVEPSVSAEPLDELAWRPVEPDDAPAGESARPRTGDETAMEPAEPSSSAAEGAAALRGPGPAAALKALLGSPPAGIETAEPEVPAFIAIEEPGDPTGVPIASPDDETTAEEAEDGASAGAGGGRSAADTLALPSATARTTPRSSRPRPVRDGRAKASGSRWTTGIGVAIAIPAVAALLVNVLPRTGAASAADGGVAAVVATAPADAADGGTSGAIAPFPRDDPAEIPLGDDHAAGVTPAAAPSPDAAMVDPGASSAPLAGEGISIVTSGPTDRKVVALTFDDGYAPANVRSIFETLVREAVPATFFINGYYLSRDPALWKEIAAAGFPVGNHTYYHVDIRTLTADEIRVELEMTENAWRRVTGTEMIKSFRPPYGARDAASDAAVAAAGYRQIVLWNASSADTKKGITDAASTAAALNGGPGAIVLLHAGPDVTPRILRDVIAGYRSRGFEFVTIPELLGG